MCDQCQKWKSMGIRCYACDREGWAKDYEKAWKKIKADYWAKADKLEVACDTSIAPGTRGLLN